MEKIVEHIRGSKLSDPLKTQVLSQVDTIIYKHLTVVRIEFHPNLKFLLWITQLIFENRAKQM